MKDVQTRKGSHEMPYIHKLRARFTRWFCRKDIDPDERLSIWLRIAMYWLFSHDLYLWLCLHPVWIKRKPKTDIVIVIAEYFMREDEPCEPNLKARLKWPKI